MAVEPTQNCDAPRHSTVMPATFRQLVTDREAHHIVENAERGATRHEQSIPGDSQFRFAPFNDPYLVMYSSWRRAIALPHSSPFFVPTDATATAANNTQPRVTHGWRSVAHRGWLPVAHRRLPVQHTGGPERFHRGVADMRGCRSACCGGATPVTKNSAHPPCVR